MGTMGAGYINVGKMGDFPAVMGEKVRIYPEICQGIWFIPIFLDSVRLG